MLNEKLLGMRINERRKAQGLTQEQLGSTIGVSAQAVSKWENGDSTPDISILPELCKVLEVTADFLLGVENHIGIETLGRQMAEKFSKGSEEDRMKILSFLHFGNMRVKSTPRWNKSCNIAYKFQDGKFERLDFWAAKGIAVFIQPSLLAAEPPREEALEILRTAISPKCWSILMMLLAGPKKASVLREELGDETNSMEAVLEVLLEKGIIIQEKQGYRLDTNFGLYLTGLLKAVGCTLLKSDTGGWGVSVSDSRSESRQ